MHELILNHTLAARKAKRKKLDDTQLELPGTGTDASFQLDKEAEDELHSIMLDMELQQMIEKEITKDEQ